MAIMKQNRQRYYLICYKKTYKEAWKYANYLKQKYGGRYQIIPKGGEYELWFTKYANY